MTAKRNYSRYFIILQEDERGYSVDPNKFPTGYAKVERKDNKCKVSYYVQNLKKSNDDYCMVLICDRKKDKRLVKLGEINIDDYGRAEVSYEYDINNIANCNIPMDNIKGASIVRIKDSNVHGILTGFVSGSKLDDWKSYVVIEGENRAEKEEKEEKAKVKEKVKEKVEAKPKIEVKAEVEENIFDKYESDVEKHKESEEKSEKELRDIKEDSTEKEYNKEEKIEVKDSESIKKEVNEDGVREAEVVEEAEKIQDREDQNEENIEEGTKTIKKIDEIKERIKDEIKDELRQVQKQQMEEDLEKIKDDKSTDNEDKNEEEKIEDTKKDIKEEDTRKCHCDCKDKKKSKDKKESKKKDNCPYEQYCHMNWEKEYYNHIVEGLKEEKGICEELGKCQWYKIDYMDLIQMRPGMDFSKYSMIYYPMVNYVSYIMRKGHYLMGFKYDKEGKMKYLVYGIPGTKSIVDQPFNGATGFVTWVPAHANKDKNNNGYWVMFYDFKKCTVVIPVKK